MKKIGIAAALLVSATPISAMAIDACKISASDAQVRICTYDPDQRYVVTGVVGFPVNLRFGDDERIKRTEFAYTGFDAKASPTQTWRGPAQKADSTTPLTMDRFKTNLPIWPFQDGRSALLVVTQREDGTERPYQFDLSARKPGDCNQSDSDPGCPGDVRTTAALSFVYPTDKTLADSKALEEKKRVAAQARAAAQATKKEAAGIARLKTDVLYGERNWAYQAKADEKYKVLVPREVSDNGWLTEFQWPENVQMPSITIIDPVTGDERIAPVSQQGDMQIVSTTAEWFRLRLGKEAVMDIHNLKWSAERPNPGTGTTSPDVVRQVTYR